MLKEIFEYTMLMTQNEIAFTTSVLSNMILVVKAIKYKDADIRMELIGRNLQV